MEPFPHTVTCHCGDLRGSFRYSDATIKVWDCNCSDCSMRGNAHFIPGDSFRLEESDEEYRAKTILYLWGTKTAQRRFCKRCGILPWYVPRSNPDGIAITFACATFAEGNKPKVEKCNYDGINWEKSRKKDIREKLLAEQECSNDKYSFKNKYTGKMTFWVKSSGRKRAPPSTAQASARKRTKISTQKNLESSTSPSASHRKGSFSLRPDGEFRLTPEERETLYLGEQSRVVCPAGGGINWRYVEEKASRALKKMMREKGTRIQDNYKGSKLYVLVPACQKTHPHYRHCEEKRAKYYEKFFYRHQQGETLTNRFAASDRQELAAFEKETGNKTSRHTSSPRREVSRKGSSSSSSPPKAPSRTPPQFLSPSRGLRSEAQTSTLPRRSADNTERRPIQQRAYFAGESSGSAHHDGTARTRMLPATSDFDSSNQQEQEVNRVIGELGNRVRTKIATLSDGPDADLDLDLIDALFEVDSQVNDPGRASLLYRHAKGAVLDHLKSANDEKLSDGDIDKIFELLVKMARLNAMRKQRQEEKQRKHSSQGPVS